MEELKDIIKRIATTEPEILIRSRRKFTAEDCKELTLLIGGRIVPGGFGLDNANRDVYHKFTSWLLGQGDLDPLKGIYLAGNVGTGKSVCMKVMRTLAYELDLKVKYGNSVERLAWKTWRTDEVCAIFASTGDLSPFKEARVACFDDLGSEPMETLYMGNRVNVMREVIEYRGDRPDLITLFTSNVPIDRLGAIGERVRYGQRAQSRIYQMCNYLVLGGADRRRV